MVVATSGMLQENTQEIKQEITPLTLHQENSVCRHLGLYLKKCIRTHRRVCGWEGKEEEKQSQALYYKQV